MSTFLITLEVEAVDLDTAIKDVQDALMDAGKVYMPIVAHQRAAGTEETE